MNFDCDLRQLTHNICFNLTRSKRAREDDACEIMEISEPIWDDPNLRTIRGWFLEI